MPISDTSARRTLDRILRGTNLDEITRRLLPRSPEEHPLPPRVPAGNDFTGDGLKKRQAFLAAQGFHIEHLAGNGTPPDPASLKGNIENLVGFARMPVGIIGPLRVNGLHAHGDVYVPLATTEGAMVASYHRGAYLISHAGGATVLCVAESISRAPCFIFESVRQAALFATWVISRTASFQDIVARTSRHCQFVDARLSISGRELFVILEFTTGDAAGQNMVTVAAEAICRELLEGAPIRPSRWLLEGNLSGDKKATMIAFTQNRGKMVIAETVIPDALVRRILHTTPPELAQTAAVSLRGGIQSGSIGAQGHYANALAALFIACGQDAACVSEASVGMTTMEVTAQGDLYAAVNLPNLTVGTVGGGTHLPAARECLELMGCRGEGGAARLAEICAATALAGEISIMGAMSAGEFGGAHARYRHKPGAA